MRGQLYTLAALLLRKCPW